MLKQFPDTSQHDAYLALAQRIQDAITSDKAQIEHQVLLIRSLASRWLTGSASWIRSARPKASA